MQGRIFTRVRLLGFVLAITGAFALGRLSADDSLWQERLSQLRTRVAALLAPASPPPSNPVMSAAPEPTTVVLPNHFPTSGLESLEPTDGRVTLREALAACWPNRPELYAFEETEVVTRAVLESIFGKITQEEPLPADESPGSKPVSATEATVVGPPTPVLAAVGLLFDASRFAGGAAGLIFQTAMNSSETPAENRSVERFRIRVDGRMLECAGIDACECL